MDFDPRDHDSATMSATPTRRAVRAAAVLATAIVMAIGASTERGRATEATTMRERSGGVQGTIAKPLMSTG